MSDHQQRMEPGTVPIFEIPIAITDEDIDAMDHVNNIVYLRWVQEAATAHWFAAATQEDRECYLWVVVRHEIDYLHPAVRTDSIVARTYVGEAQGARFIRFVEIRRSSDDRVLAKARTIWAALDGATGRPRRVSEPLRRRFTTPKDG